ncbi:glutamyl-tRNA synthetase [Ekhidna lutea]|uniref:Glutamate--tRNA ligase n=1 Tax=Ekhidna lutea TaxID=447679 RepID=A0A239KQ16_EKHLU|nr:glutamate--tRNA ligase [Ekhidna lutea]SNT19822.1 glutamyl-tRNA synthetase [Ekhidna lutea]
MDNVRVRFAPSPTGGLHIGGVRTALFNYLFAKKHNGTFILRIEDTDQTRSVEGAEEYIKNTLDWCGINPEEGPDQGGEYGPYRQSDRKNIYKQYAEKLIADGNAYYAFDTPEELEAMRERLKESRVVNPQYDTVTRTTMKNSLTLSEEEVKRRIDNGDPYVIRIKIPKKEEVRLNDMVRGWVMVHTEVLDDKVLMKSDGMPTYHLANIVDDHLMKITHVIRGEEWLPSAPLHVLLYQFLGWEDEMPQFAHLPLILKPDGNGKLSKRAADKAGFPIFPLNWKDPGSNEVSVGFKETGFLPEAMVNFLAFLGWNPGTEQEIFSLEELVKEFSDQRINKAGTKFDFDKAKWFNQQYIKARPSEDFVSGLIEDLKTKHDISCDADTAIKIIDLLKERVTFQSEFAANGLVIFQAPSSFDEKVLKKKWKEDTPEALRLFAEKLQHQDEVDAEAAKSLFWETLEASDYKPGQFMQPLRLTLTGEGSGPDLMAIIEILGGEKAAERILSSISLLENQS